MYTYKIIYLYTYSSAYKEIQGPPSDPITVFQNPELNSTGVFPLFEACINVFLKAVAREI